MKNLFDFEISMQKIFIKLLVWIVTLFIFLVIINDIEKHDNGYLHFLSSYFDTKSVVPFTRAKIFLIISFFLANSMIRILFWGIQKLGTSGKIFYTFQENEEPDIECCRYLSIMQKVDHIHQLDELLSYAINQWPQWQK